MAPASCTTSCPKTGARTLSDENGRGVWPEVTLAVTEDVPAALRSGRGGRVRADARRRGRPGDRRAGRRLHLDFELNYFAPVHHWAAVERRGLRFVRGRVLDVCVGAGRVALELQARGREVVAEARARLSREP